MNFTLSKFLAAWESPNVGEWWWGKFPGAQIVKEKIPQVKFWRWNSLQDSPHEGKNKECGCKTYQTSNPYFLFHTMSFTVDSRCQNVIIYTYVKWTHVFYFMLKNYLLFISYPWEFIGFIDVNLLYQCITGPNNLSMFNLSPYVSFCA